MRAEKNDFENNFRVREAERMWEWIDPPHLGGLSLLLQEPLHHDGRVYIEATNFNPFEQFPNTNPKHKYTKIHKRIQKKYKRNTQRTLPTYIRRPCSRVRVSHTHYYICSPGSHQSRRGCCSLVNINLSWSWSATNHNNLLAQHHGHTPRVDQ